MFDRVISVDEPDFKSVNQAAENHNILHPIPKGSSQLPRITDLKLVNDQYSHIMSNNVTDIFEHLIYHTTKSQINEFCVLKKQVINQGDNNGK